MALPLEWGRAGRACKAITESDLAVRKLIFIRISSVQKEKSWRIYENEFLMGVGTNIRESEP